MIRCRLVTLGSTTMGYRKDDFATTSPMCEGTEGNLYRKGILGSPDDIDEFEFFWPTGEMTVEAVIPEVSAALIAAELRQGDGAGPFRTELERGASERGEGSARRSVYRSREAQAGGAQRDWRIPGRARRL